MEKTLQKLFDYQRFSGNPRLQKVIDAVHARSAPRRLSEEEAELVAAAGAPYRSPDDPEGEAGRPV